MKSLLIIIIIYICCFFISHPQILPVTPDYTCNRDAYQQYSQCTFKFMLTYNCTRKLFIYCSYDNQPQDGMNNNQSQMHEKRKITDVRLCRFYCCQSIYGQNIQLYNQLKCHYSSKSNILTNHIDYFRTIVAVIGIFIITSIFIGIYRCYKSQNNRIRRSVQLYGLKQDRFSKKSIIKQWRQFSNIHKKEQEKFQLQNCSICLSQRPNCHMKCNHFYHKICIVEWMKVNLQCPLCRSKGTNALVVLCEKCGVMSYECALQQIASSMESHDICPNCLPLQNLLSDDNLN